jgi:hypothetical protein
MDFNPSHVPPQHLSGGSREASAHEEGPEGAGGLQPPDRERIRRCLQARAFNISLGLEVQSVSRFTGHLPKRNVSGLPATQVLNDDNGGFRGSISESHHFAVEPQGL